MLMPFLGAILYWQFGVNRMNAVGLQLRRRWPEPDNSDLEDPTLTGDWPPEHISFSRLSRKVVCRRLEIGNAIDLLVNGEEAYPAMLEAIRNAEESVNLCSYIFDSDRVGLEFVDALSAAVRRGVNVKVLVDSMGEKYSRPRVSRLLTKKGVPIALFLPWTLRPFKLHMNLYMNLRNHRKILVVDGAIAFTGGMNIGVRHLADAVDNPKKAQDLHFKIQGPVVADIEQAFLEDWFFASGENCLRSEPLNLRPAGSSYCRVIIDGPNEDFEKLKWMFIGAINAARYSIHIMTPYFVPDRVLIAALCAAHMRGVDVRIIIPEKGNLAYVGWATDALLWQLLEHGVEVYRQPLPFNHSKLFIVDDCYAIIGSANFDARSLRLNFEFNMDIYGEEFVAVLLQHVDDILAVSQQVTLEEMDSRSLPIRLRDGFARLFSPYL